MSTQGSDAEMIAEIIVAVAEVCGLDDLNEVLIVSLLEMWHRCPFGIGGDLIVGNFRDRVHCLAFAADRWFHGLVVGGICLWIGQLIATALDQVLCLCIDLELRDNSLDDVGFVIADVLIEMDSTDCAVLKFDLEWLLADWHRLVLSVLWCFILIPSVWHLVIDLSVLSVSQLHDDGIAIAWTHRKLSLHHNSGILFLHVGESGESTTTNLVDVFLVLIPCTVPFA